MLLIVDLKISGKILKFGSKCFALVHPGENGENYDQIFVDIDLNGRL